ncbi:MAG: hypothetical protein K7J46_07090 [Bryobacter sp.]|jgi:hypothetical protein|nr:hypothetical protein [Bryobacter sp. CoA8 C33]
MLALFSILALSAAPDAQTIMNQVAANLARGSDLRAQYVYSQKLHTRLLRTNSKLAREERRTYNVFPSPQGVEHKLIHFDGQYEKHGKIHPYTDPKFRHKDLDIDGEIIADLAEDLVADKNSKDGIDMDLFPFLPKDLPHYTFKLLSSENYRGRPVHRISFEPVKDDEDAKPWAGEMLIDAEDLHPLSIQTKLTLKIHFLVKTILGSDIRQTGFSLTYTRVAPGLWFPATYGTEMRVDVLFGYKRIITLNMESSGFRKASADSSITFETPQP